MDVWRPQISRGECLMVGFIQLLHMASPQTLQTKIVAYDTRYRGLGETRLLDIWRVSSLLG